MIDDEMMYLRRRLQHDCRIIGIEPYDWQVHYALTGHLPGGRWPEGRRTGKTMAVMLYGLIRDVWTKEEIRELACRDPDCYTASRFGARMRRDWFAREYSDLRQAVIVISRYRGGDDDES